METRDISNLISDGVVHGVVSNLIVAGNLLSPSCSFSMRSSRDGHLDHVGATQSLAVARSVTQDLMFTHR